MKKIGNYTISSYIISSGKYSTIYQGVDAKQNLVAIKEIKRTDFATNQVDIKSPIIQDLLKLDNQYVIRLIDVVEQGLFIYFIEELGISNLAKEVKKNEIRGMTEKSALFNFSQILNGYKWFFKKNLVYRHLTPYNIIRIEHKLKLSIPSTIFNLNVDNSNEQVDLSNDEYLYFSPEQLVDSETIDHKADIWALGCILYVMLYGSHPWGDYSLPKKYINLKDPSKTIKYRNFGLYQFIQFNGLRFPQPNPINSTLIDLLKRMLEFDPAKRISLTELLNHPFLDYFSLLGKAHKEGSVVELTKSKFSPSVLNISTLTKFINDFEKKKVKNEIKQNYQKKKQKLDDMESNPGSEIIVTNSFIPDPDMQMDQQSISDLEQICSEIDLKSKSDSNSLRQSVLTPMDIANNDKIIEELEIALNASDGPGEEENNTANMNIDQLANFITSLKKRIMLKITAFDEIKSIVTSAYIFAFRFFLLKSALYDMIKLEKKLLQDPNPFNSKNWEEFKAKPVYAKIVNSLFKQEDRIADMIDEYLPKALAVLKNSKIKFNSSFIGYLNKDPYQDCSLVLGLLFENLINGHLLPRVKHEIDGDKRLKLMKFAVLVKLILMIEQYGKFTQIDPALEFANVWQETDASSDSKFVELKYQDLVLNI